MSKIFELEEVLEQPEDDQKGFSINDDATADWALQKIAKEQEELDRLKNLAKQQIEEIQMKVAHLEEVAGRKTSFLKGCLAQYFQTVPHKSTKTQESYKLLSGSLVFKLPKQSMKADDEKLLEYFRQNNLQEYIKTEEKPKWGDFKKNLAIVDGEVVDTSTGEVIKAVSIEDVPGEFSVKTN